MTIITKLKAKNQLTIPNEIVKRLHLKAHELFAVDVEKNYIKLTPVDVEPRYTQEELEAVDRLVTREKSKEKKALGRGTNVARTIEAEVC